MHTQLAKIKKTIADFLIYLAATTVIEYFIDHGNYGDFFERRLITSLRHALLISLAIVFFAALFRWVIKWKIMMTLKRIKPDDVEICQSILKRNRWTKLTKEEKDTISDIIDKTAFKYSS